jgi:hypothetical protein
MFKSNALLGQVPGCILRSAGKVEVEAWSRLERNAKDFDMGDCAIDAFKRVGHKKVTRGSLNDQF